jgi:hypothetical protein
MEITEEIIDKTAEMVRGNLADYREEISEAYSKHDEILEIKLSARYSFNKGKFKIQTKINFVTDRIKDDSVVWYDPEQRQMFESADEIPDPASEAA